MLIGSTDAGTQGPVAINMDELHVCGTARMSRGVLERGRWQFRSTKFGAQHILGAGFAPGTLDGANSKQEPSHHPRILEMMLLVVADTRPKQKFVDGL